MNSSYRPFEHLKPRSRVLLAFSGGVDSSVAAFLAKQAGFDVLAVHLRLLPEDDSTVRAQTAADRLGIPLRFLDLTDEFRERVMRPCWKIFASGRTPNPCAVCNPVFKFGSLLRSAEELDCSALVTGHYVRTVPNDDGEPLLARGTFRPKDQSYFLFGLSRRQINAACFPLGDMSKDEVRAIAREIGLPNADAPESQDACFAPKDASVTLAESLRVRFGAVMPSGNFVEAGTGRVLGRHIGIHAYTIGQRKGTGVAMGVPAFVRRVLPASNTVELTTDPVLLESSEVILRNVNWQQTRYARLDSFRADVQLRYRSRAIPVLCSRTTDGDLLIRFDHPWRAVTPGQAAVLYDADARLIGGAFL